MSTPAQSDPLLLPKRPARARENDERPHTHRCRLHAVSISKEGVTLDQTLRFQKRLACGLVRETHSTPEGIEITLRNANGEVINVVRFVGPRFDLLKVAIARSHRANGMHANARPSFYTDADRRPFLLGAFKTAGPLGINVDVGAARGMVFYIRRGGKQRTPSLIFGEELAALEKAVSDLEHVTEEK